MFGFRHVIVIVLGINFVKVGGHNADALGQNYSRVFKDMPALFERILETLQEKPEVLERDDVITFYDSNLANQVSQLSPDEVNLDKREANDYDFIDDFGNTGEREYDLYLLKASDDFEGFAGSVGSDVSQLITADEMVEMMLMIESKLEEYNHDND